MNMKQLRRRGRLMASLPLRRDQGAVLLAFMLVLIVSSTYVLLSDLSEHAEAFIRDTENERVLHQARQALLFYAMNYPELRDSQEKGPGFLPCPDQDNDGISQKNCSKNTGTTLGRLPFAILGLEDLRDSSGERLWYALSDNFKNVGAGSDDAVINSETPGQLTVDGVTDIVAVIIAPGSPVGHQGARPGNDAGEYLEDANVTARDDGAFVTTSDNAFNDQLIAITRAELMEVVEQRVIHEFRAALVRYKRDHSAYPWLARFADPRADNRLLRGAHDGADNSQTLTDPGRDFIAWGVAAGDVARNITDQSMAIVTGVTADTLTFAGFSLGDENDFDKGDGYVIELRGLAGTLSRRATGGSGGLEIKDTNRDFRKLGIVAGDVVENVSDGSSGVVLAVAPDALTLKGLTGGAENDVDPGDEYQIRSNGGIATGGSAGLTLEDTSVSFIAMGVAVGDVVQNISDGSRGRVLSVDSATQLTVSALDFGGANAFKEGDAYRIPRYNGSRGTREGLISVHEPGEMFASGFTLDWRLSEEDGEKDGARLSSSTPGTQPLYDDALRKAALSSPTDGGMRVGFEAGHCLWTTVEIIDCTGVVQAPYLAGAITSTWRFPVTRWNNPDRSQSPVIMDESQDFVAAGIERGDIIQHYGNENPIGDGTATLGSDGMTLVDEAADFSRFEDDGQYHLFVRNTSRAGGGLVEVLNAHTLRALNHAGLPPADFRPGDSYTIYAPHLLVVKEVEQTRLIASVLSAATPDFNEGDYYRIKKSTRRISDRIDGLGGKNEIYYAPDNRPSSPNYGPVSKPFDFIAHGVRVGDVIEKVSNGSFGLITQVGRQRAGVLSSSSWLTVDGVLDGFNGQDEFRIYHAYINLRRYKFNLRYRGRQTIQTSKDGVRQRAVCLGAACGKGSDEAPDDVAIPYYDMGVVGAVDTATGLSMEDADGDFIGRGVRPGDTIFTGDEANGSTATIATVGPSRITAHTLTGGAGDAFRPGAPYQISRPLVMIEDLNDDGVVLGHASVTIPLLGAQGYLHTRDVDYYLAETSGELPPWFIKNKWHQLLFVAYSAGFQPGADNLCLAGTDCLTLQGIFHPPAHDRKALVISAGMELAGQNRRSGLIGDYFEGENATTDDDIFHNGELTTTFNDQAAVASP